MEKFIYGMRNGKIVNSTVPTDNLIMYIDTRGKKNSDTYKNLLYDLSGNGNHGTLQNFSFTEESGYVKGLSGGLKFDGVDDYLSISRDFTFKEKPFTYFVDFKILRTATEQNNDIYLGLGFFLHNANNLIYNALTNNPYWNTHGDTQVGVGRHIFACTMGDDFTKAKYFLDGNSVFIYNKILSDGTPAVFVDKPGDITIPADGVKKINKLMIWDRALTDEEITQIMEV